MAKPDRLALQRDEEDEERDDSIINVALVGSLIALAAVVLIGLGGWYLLRKRPMVEVTDRQVELPAAREKTEAVIPDLKFTDITASSGIQFVHENGALGEKLLPETMGSGCAIFDYDGDGDQDILLLNGQRWPWDTRPAEGQPPTMKLYRNDGQAHFDDVTAEVGLAISMYGMGCAVGDIDNDGDPDLFVTAVGVNHLFRNDHGTFVEITADAGVAGDARAWSTGAALFDYDNDGLLDLFVCNYVEWTRQFDLAQEFQLTGVGRAYGPPRLFPGSFPYLYHNEGNCTFRDVSEESGVQVRNPNTGVPMAKSLGVMPVDLDQDGWTDLVVANDTVQNFMYHNEHGKFREIGIESGVAFDNRTGLARGAMGIFAARFRNNRMLGIAIGNFANEMAALYVAQREPLQFFDAAVPTGLGPATQLQLTFGVLFLDVDMDGRQDLLCANGHLEQEINRVLPSQHYEQSPQLMYNAGSSRSGEFVPVPVGNVGEAFAKPMVARGAAYADLDGDGDLDVLLTSVGGPPRLLRNDQKLGHHWLRFRLHGKKTNRDAIGAWVEIERGDQLLSRQVMPTCSYLSQVELPVTFGLGDDTKIDRVTVRWPAGHLQQVQVDEVDRTYELTEE